MTEPRILRVVDFGVQPPRRSQTLWHAVAYGVSDGAPPTLSFVRPAAPYVSIGYHRGLDEVDLEACQRDGLPVFRRMIGGGPVYLDRNQLFFQIAVPSGSVGGLGAHVMRKLLAPAVRAFSDVGVEAHLDELGDISTPDGAKISGVGGGRIADASIAVGNLIESFDHERMVRVLRLDASEADEVLRLMRRYVTPTPAPAAAFKAALVRRYAEALDARSVVGELEEGERRALAELDERFEDVAWIRGHDRADDGVRRIKIRAGVWVFDARAADTRVFASVVHGVLERVRVADPESNGGATAIEEALSGAGLEDADAAARRFGPPGERVAELIGRAMRRVV